MAYSSKDILQLQESIELKKYLREHYGQCSSNRCSCLKTGTVGTQCQSWVPTSATTYEELSIWQDNLKIFD